MDQPRRRRGGHAGRCCGTPARAGGASSSPKEETPMRKVLTLLSAALVGLSGLFMAPAMATAVSAPSAAPTIGYAVGDAMLGTGGSAQHLTFSMVDRSSGDRGTVSYTNASAGVAYDAGVMAVVATNSEARFAYTIPSTAPTSVSGLIIVWQVRNSSPDTAGFSVAATAG